MRIKPTLTQSRLTDPCPSYRVMGRVVRKAQSLVGLPRTPVLAAAASCILLASCSADVTRFDFPVLGLTEDSSTNSLPVPPESVPRYAPNEQARPYQNEQRDPNWGGTFDSGTARSRELSPDYGARAPEPYPASPSDGGYTYGGAARSTPSYQAPVAEPRSLERRRSYSTSPSAGTRSGAYESEGSATLNSTTSGADETVTVATGDTLYGIARRHGVSVSALMSANGLTNSSIRVGQKLALPGSTAARSLPTRQVETRDVVRETPRVTAGSGEYRVAPGDSLYQIASNHGVSVRDLQDANDISDPTRLKIGQVLTIPGGSRSYTSGGPAFAEARRTGDMPKLPAFEVESPQVDEPVDAPRERTASIDESGGRNLPSAAEATGGGDASLDTGGQFRWPVKGRIVMGFGRRSDGSHNDGINIAVPAGTSVRAAADGVVAYAGSELKGYGNLVLIRHDDNWVSAYAHNESLLVARGDKVRRGQVIAKAGLTGSVDQPQVHFELRKGSKPVDPMEHLASASASN